MTNALTVTSSPIVTVRGDKAFTNSKDVADFFGKQHKHILDTADGLIEGGVPGFRQTYKSNGQNGQSYRSFDMTKDGFTLLAMGFTGAKALRFKLAYIARFNELEARSKPVIGAARLLQPCAGCP